MEPTTPTDQTSAPVTTRTRRYRGRAAIAALGLVTASAGLGSVYVMHHHRDPGSLSGAVNPYSAQPVTGWGRSYVQQLQPYSDQQAASTETAADATAEQSTGLVEITSTLADGVAKGTGLILDSDGTVVTNHHVVAGATSIKVTVVATGKTYRARFVGADATADVAVLELQDASGLTPVSFATEGVAAGDAVTAVGDAGGDGGSLTASPGTVTAFDQSIAVQDDDGGESRLSGLIELHAYVVPGDSGGAVLNADGEVVGMNVAASSGSQDVTGYAIPSSTVRSIAAKILAGDTGSGIKLGYSGYLGIELSAASDDPVVAGVQSGGAAARAGIADGATITKVDGVAITSATQLHDVVAAKSPGDRIRLTWRTSSGSTRSAVVTLGTGPVA